MTTTRPRLVKLVAYRKARGAVECLRHGPFDRDGRRYAGELRDRCPCVAVTAIESDSGRRNAPEAMP